MIKRIKTQILLALALIPVLSFGSYQADCQVVKETGENELQLLLEKTNSDTLVIEGGYYYGPISINKPIVLIGKDEPVIDGRNNGTVIEINSPGVEVSGFNIINSGKSLSNEDAGITITAADAKVTGNRIEEVLFGVYIKRGSNSLVKDNVISGKKELLVPRRGDLIRVWYSDSVQVDNNILTFGRDMIIWFSKNTIVKNNRVSNARYGIHFMYSDDCLIQNNIFINNSVGAYLMYSRRLVIRKNTFAYNRSASGFGIGLKDFDDGVLEDNLIIDNRVGIYVDNSPRSIDSRMDYKGNVIAYNDVGFSLLSFIKRSYITNNSFIENYEQVGISGSGFLTGNYWNNNYWSDYFGFDKDGNGIGDIPYKSEKLFEDMISRYPALRLFIYSPAIQAINFAAQAFPIVKPQPKLEDPTPLMQPYFPKGLATVEQPAQKALSIFSIGMFFLGIVLMSRIPPRLKNMFRQSVSDRRCRMIKNNSATAIQSNRNNTMIKIENLTKKFGKTTAVNDVSFSVTTGEAVALWGPNGAGKTTVLRCILGVFPFDGNAKVNGYDIKTESKKAKYHIGFVPQEIMFHDNMTVKETLKFYEKLKKTEINSSGKWLDLVGLENHSAKTVKELSGGMKQRLALAIALLADPPLLLLDEPTANLDMKSREDFLSLLKELKADGKTIVFSSHRLDEVIPFADRIIIMDQGKIIAESTPENIYKHIGKSSQLRIFLSNDLIDPAIGILQKDGFNVSRNGAGIKIKIETDQKILPINALLKSGIEIVDFEYIIEN